MKRINAKERLKRDTMRLAATASFIIFACITLCANADVLADSSPAPTSLTNAYHKLWDKLQAKTDIELNFRTSLQRRLTWGSDSLDAKRLANSPDIAAEKMLQETLDAQIIDAVVSATALPISSVPGSRETLLSGKDPQPVAYFVPTQPPRRMLLLLPGVRETDSDLASRALLRGLADSTRTLLVVPSLDRASSIQDIVEATTRAADAFATAYHFEPSQTFLGGASNGAFLQFEVPLLAHRHFAAYLSIAGALPGSDRRRIVSTLRAQNSTAYFVAGALDPDVSAATVRASVSTCRAAGVYALYYEQPQGMNSIVSLAPAITRAWMDMIHGVNTIPDDGLGTMPADSLPI